MSPARVTGLTGGSGTSSAAASAAAGSVCARRVGHQRADLFVAEAHEVEIEARCFDRLHLLAKNLLVPPGVHGQFVVGDHQGPALRLRQVSEHDDRHLGHAQLARRQHPGVAGNNHAVGPDQNRVCPAELHDRCRDLSHLGLRMRARVAGKRQQIPDRPQLDAGWQFYCLQWFR